MRKLFKREPDPFKTYDSSGLFRSVRTRSRKHMRHRWQWVVLASLVVVGSGAGFVVWKYFELQGDIQIRGLPVVPREERLDPFNALLVGSDSRTGLTAAEQHELGANAVPGERADTLILAHIDPAANRVTMVQFPRDLFVPIAGDGDNKINAALEQGPKTLIQTVSRLTGLDINHYLQVNIAGFRDLVNAIGGVSVCITEPIPFDKQTGIEVTEDELGFVRFDGDRALRFVRSRHFATGDFERIRNQQKFLAAAIDKVTSTDTLLNPQRVLKLADIAGVNLRTDDNISLFGLRDLGNRLRHFDPEHYEAYTLPNLGVANNEAGSVVLPDMGAMRLLFEAIERNESPEEFDGVPSIAPNTIRVAVYNGTFQDGAAAAVADRLEDATDTGQGGVKVEFTDNANRFDHKTTLIRYRPEAESMAEVIAAALPNAEVVEGRTEPGVDVAVVVGKRGTRTGDLVQILPLPIPPPGQLPEECRR